MKPLGLIGIAIAIAFAGCGGDDGGDVGGEQSAAPPPLPACTEEGQRTNFPVYSVGPSFAGLEQTKEVRRCDDAAKESPEARAEREAAGEPVIDTNYASVIYGDCDAEPSCAYPLEVQTWPACARRAGTASDAIERRRLRVRGVPAASFEDGRQLELYTRDATVVFFGRDPGVIRRAAVSAVPLAAGEPFPPEAVAQVSGEGPDLAPASAADLRAKNDCG